MRHSGNVGRSSVRRSRRKRVVLLSLTLVRNIVLRKQQWQAIQEAPLLRAPVARQLISSRFLCLMWILNCSLASWASVLCLLCCSFRVVVSRLTMLSPAGLWPAPWALNPELVFYVRKGVVS